MADSKVHEHEWEHLTTLPEVEVKVCKKCGITDKEPEYCLLCDDTGKIYNNADETSGMWHWCTCTRLSRR